MKNTYSIFAFGDEYTCTEFFDVDIQAGGIEIKNAFTDEHIGSMIGECVPDIDADEEEIMAFEEKVIAWLVDNDK
jgi:hypothetical protein